MLSKRFKADEAKAISLEANNWIDKVDELIAKAVLEGLTEANIYLCGDKNYNEVGKIWYQAPDFFVAHYKSRGFLITKEGQCNLKISWS